MIRSMTGFGAAERQGAGVVASAEVKSTNGRFLKLSMRLPPALSAREQDLEALVRTRLRRGSATLKIELRQEKPSAVVKVDEEVVKAYQEIFRRLGVSEEPLATLPGVLVGGREEVDDEAFAVVRKAVEAALDELVIMRQREGKSLAAFLGGICDRIEELAREVRSRAPSVVLEYRDRLHTRITALVEGFGTAIDAQLVAREVALFADRCDITEELDRLGSHVAQVRELLTRGEEAGRTLDFLSQEMVREANTTGSKSADASLGRLVVQLKTEIERFKEQVANDE
jgi:uncharacterized protein (TIGR00255 family)